MNETLRRALLKAQLSEDDIAARLGVDPKTVRRWTEGRLPYLRHRWQLASILGCDETDLWPQVSSAQSRPAEVLHVYPQLEAVPTAAWRGFFESAERQIGILARTGLFIAEQPDVLATLANRAEAGVRVRICVLDPEAVGQFDITTPDDHDGLSSQLEQALTRYKTLQGIRGIELRVHRLALSALICRVDDGLLASQYLYGTASSRSPVIHLRQLENAGMADMYLRSFDRSWITGRPCLARPGQAFY